MSKRTAKRENKFTRCVKALSRSASFSVRTLTDGSCMMNSGSVDNVRRSYSVNSSRSNEDEDVRLLVRAASQRDRGLVEVEMESRKQTPNKLPRSFTVVTGRNGDKPCDYQEDYNVKPDLILERSKSYAVAKRAMTAMYS